MRKIIVFLIYTHLRDEILRELKSHLEDVFSLETEFYGLSIDINDAYNFTRNQYLASKIIKKMFPYKNNWKDKWIFFVDVDLYTPGLNFIFGEAYPRYGIAIVSLTRLKPEFYGSKPNERLFTERLLKETTHELGHLFYLHHCENPNCVMHFSNSILDTDRKSKYFCLNCNFLLKANMLII
ncbi:archaemetzincin family Zn-dependent metalloprotease [Thermodesulfobacterium hydrogeniphilum]|uniref:archaemetzincin family Zn-dependent metalloprotease n=1 Tax=Thermodesulfobacterium hydrogeniphilum TaxID=161156 RepID=UPI00056E7F66|nr:archaemetzincin family Zn-dependent metalloprotease [Thermodesulfobacterium hydrogeniphilum]